MPKTIQLHSLAYGRSGDKGNNSNIGLIARKPEFYPILERHVIAEAVADHFSELCFGKVRRYLLKNLCAMNFVLEQSLDGGGTISLRIDAQGKTFAAALLRMQIVLTDEEAHQLTAE